MESLRIRKFCEFFLNHLRNHPLGAGGLKFLGLQNILVYINYYPKYSFSPKV